MNKEESLSDKRICVNKRTQNWHYKEADLKEFIKRLKEELAKEQENWTNGDGATLVSNEVIDKLAGDKLI